MAMLTRLSGLPATVAYNLFIPTLLALTLTSAFSLVYNLVMQRAEASGEESEPGPALGFGLLGALFVGILGNLEGLLEVFHSRGLFPTSFWSWLDIKDINQPLVPDGWIPTRFIWWWRASRVIHDCSFQGLLSGNCNPPNGDWEVIDEFPFFSFMLGDVHPHVLALPFVLLALALALNQILNRRGGESTNPQTPPSQSLFSKLRSRISNLVTSAFGGWPEFVIYAICLGGLGFLNTWDFPIYLFIVTLALALRRALTGAHNWAAEAVATGLGLGILGGVLYLPFYLGFQSQASGILPNLFNPTKLQQFLVFFGPFLFVIVSYLVVISREAAPLDGRRRLPGLLALTWGGPVAALLAIGLSLSLSPAAQTWIKDLLRQPDVQALLGKASLSSLAVTAARIRLSNPWTFLFLGGLLAWGLLLLLTADRRRTIADRRPQTADSDHSSAVGQLSRADLFALILVGVGLLLPLAVEFVYLRDLFGTRMNTVFKFYFQAWVLLALAAAYGASVVLRWAQGLGDLAWRLGLTLLVLAGLVYPALAIPDKTGNFGAEPALDGMAWLQAAHPDDYAAIRWLQANAPDAAVILEAPGKSYSYTGRVSALTGLPTLLGWDFHEFQWRGSYDEPARRRPDIDILYNSVDPAQTLTLLDKYAITYVYVGQLEREQYNPNGLAKFEQLMDVVYRQGEVTIYQRRGTP
jgi:YYY domain-containing protein